MIRRRHRNRWPTSSRARCLRRSQPRLYPDVMSDEPFYAPNQKPAPPRVPRPGKLLFVCLRASDRASVSCALLFQGESYGWEVQLLERGALLISRGGFVLREL